MGADILLFDAPGSPCARRVKIALLEKQLPFERIEVDLAAMEQKRPEYLALNPNGVVPTLAHGSFVLFEANTITRYLDEAFPDTPQLYPSQPEELAQVFNWQAAELVMAKRFRPLMYQRLLGPLTRMTKTRDEALQRARDNGAGHEGIAWETRVWSVDVISLTEEQTLVAWHHGWLAKLEQALSDRPFLLGTECAMADLSVAPRVALYPAIGIALRGRFPNTAAWIARMEARPSLAATKSDQEAKLQKLSQTPILPAANSLYRREGRPTLKERAIVAFKRPLLRKLTAKTASTRAPFIVPEIAERASPTDRFLPTNPPDRRYDCIKLFGSENDPVFNTGHFIAKQTTARTEKHTRDTFAVEIDGLNLSAPNEALELLATVATETGLKHPQTAQQTAMTRAWLAFAQGSEREFRPFCMSANGNSKLDRFITDKSMALLEIKRRLDILEKHLSKSAFLVAIGMTVADLRWHFELIALQRAGLEVTSQSILNWQKSIVASGTTAATAVTQ